MIAFLAVVTAIDPCRNDRHTFVVLTYPGCEFTIANDYMVRPIVAMDCNLPGTIKKLHHPTTKDESFGDRADSGSSDPIIRMGKTGFKYDNIRFSQSDLQKMPAANEPSKHLLSLQPIAGK